MAEQKISSRFCIGTDQDDRIVGDAQDNLLEGMRGNDVLDGYSGSDTLFGGGGDDIFVFRTVLSSQFDGADGHSYILDFRAGGDDDKIRLGSPVEGDASFAGTASGDMIERSGSLSAGTFAGNVNALIGAEPGENFAALVVADGGDLVGRTFLIVDDGDGVFSIDDDLVIELVGGANGGSSVTTGLSSDWFAIA